MTKLPAKMLREASAGAFPIGTPVGMERVFAEANEPAHEQRLSPGGPPLMDTVAAVSA